MRSRADTARIGAEWLLRAAAIGLLAWFLVRTMRAKGGGPVEQASSVTLADALRRWSTVVSPARVHLSFAQPPSGNEREWLHALRAAGTDVRWSASALLPSAMTSEWRVDPAGGIDVSVAAPVGATVVLRDTLGLLDSAVAGVAGVRAVVPTLRGTIDGVVGTVAARSAPRDSLSLKRLLLIGAASWEAKFTLAALEERGWRVDALIVASPSARVRQGEIGAIDTARYAAVLAIDTMAGRHADRIAAYVHSGGGLVLWSAAARAVGLRALAAGGIGTLRADEGAIPSDTAPRAVLELLPIDPLQRSAVVLERRGGDVGIAAHRVGMGRVLQTGYSNSWRWRMAGGEQAPAAHRDWLAGLVASVGYASRVQVTTPPIDPAPLANLFDRLGDPAPGPLDAVPDAARLARWLFAVIVAALLLEWLSRRVRGAT